MSENRRFTWKGSMELTLARVLEYYFVALELEGKSPKTIDWYRQKLYAFHEFLVEAIGQILARELSLDEGRAFVKSLMARERIYEDHPSRDEVNKPLSVQTIHGYVRTMRAFASWLGDEGYTESNVFERLKPPKLPETLIKPLTEDEIRRILAAIP